MTTLETDVLSGGAPGTQHGDALVDSLLHAPLFEGIQREEIVAILSALDAESFNAGHRITMQGLRGSDFFIIASGSARVLVDGEPVATLSAGDFFGEVGVLGDGLRTATVVAEHPMRCLVLPHRGLEPLLVAHPQFGVNVLREVLERFRQVTAARAQVQERSLS